MANVVTSKPKRPPKKPTKLCLKCGRVKDIDDYYVNRDWEEQLGRDIWCKDCVNKCATKDEVKEYFWENHREYSERIWEIAQSKAEKLAANNTTYQRTSDERKQVILNRLSAQQIPSVMAPFYQYVDNGKDGRNICYAEAKANGAIEKPEDENEQVYSKEFNGWFTKRDLEYLDNYYQKLEEDFTFDNESIRDYARKVCKASMQADKAQDDFARGRTGYNNVKDALAQFDMLSKSANFAACKRKPGEGGGMTSWAELTYKLETSGHPMTRKIEWEKDDVDKTIIEFHHIVEAMGLDTV